MKMSPPSYPHRYLLLSDLIAALPPTEVTDAFYLSATSQPYLAGQAPGTSGGCRETDHDNNERGARIDEILVSHWSSTREWETSDRDVLQHVENLRLKLSDFDVLGRVGEGQFGVVDAVRCRFDGNVYAMKTMEKRAVTRAGPQLSLAYERHIHLLANGDTSTESPIPGMVATFQSPTTLYLVIEYASCGTLWDRVCGRDSSLDVTASRQTTFSAVQGVLCEAELGWWAKQMVSAISWLHARGFAHRDIKPHNFIITENSRLLLTDFGSAAPILPSPQRARSGPLWIDKQHCLLPSGTPDYVAPEILLFAEEAIICRSETDGGATERTFRPEQGGQEVGYDASVDWWSLGAVIYELAVGIAPFWAPSIAGTYKRIISCETELKFPPDLKLSADVRSLISKLLVPSPTRLGRLHVAEIHRHPFFKGVDWLAPFENQNPPPLVPPPEVIHFASFAESAEESTENNDDRDLMEDITFDHFFKSSPGLSRTIYDGQLSNGVDSTVYNSVYLAPLSNRLSAETWHRWVGWSWDPPADFFGHDSASPSASSFASPITRKKKSACLSDHTFITPVRPTPGAASGSSIPRTLPRSVPRTRPLSERKAFAELLACVQASASRKAFSAKRPSSHPTQTIETPWWVSNDIYLSPTPMTGSRELSHQPLSTEIKSFSLPGHSFGKSSSTGRKESQSVRHADTGTRHHLSEDIDTRTGSQLEEMERWHRSMEGGLESLQTRLKELVTRFGSEVQ